ncbi:SpoIIAA family protein [Pontibacter mangrovi]|nr:STAS/SEC14 domain-containing protein [Pontibacter mangrovi]
MVSIIDFPEEGLAGFLVQHYLDEAGLRAVVQQLEEKAAHHDKLQVYFEFSCFGGWDCVQSFFDMLKLKFKGLEEKIDRYAIVTDKDWVKGQWRLASFLNPSVEVHTFDMAEKEQALAWLRQPAATGTV